MFSNFTVIFYFQDVFQIKLFVILRRKTRNAFLTVRCHFLEKFFEQNFLINQNYFSIVQILNLD